MWKEMYRIVKNIDDGAVKVVSIMALRAHGPRQVKIRNKFAMAYVGQMGRRIRKNVGRMFDPLFSACTDYSRVINIKGESRWD